MKYHTILLVDASGSMQSHVQETRNTIADIIKGISKNIYFSLVFFDDRKYNIIIDNKQGNIAPSLANKYYARGNTPITDAIYKAIQNVTHNNKDISNLAHKYKFIIFTDGLENASKYATASELGVAIKHFKENFGWEFQFIGPKSDGLNITRYAESININQNDITLYSCIADGLKQMKQLTINEI